jgi:biotin transport system substrate-specific component
MSHSLARPLSHPVLRPALIGAAGIAVLTLSSYVAIPMVPVPVTLQTLAVLLMGAVLGPRMGAAVVTAWLAMALAGAPVLAGGKVGLLAFTGPTAGYLLAFPVAAFLAGYLPKAQSLSAHGLRLAGFLGLHVVILTAGWAWLSMALGTETAFAAGVVPFIAGTLLKSALATAVLAALPRTKG